MRQETNESQIKKYLARKRKFDRLRRKSRLGFDRLYDLFARGLSSAEIARRAGVSRPRIGKLFDQDFRDLFGMSGLERRRMREQEAREDAQRRLARAIADHPVLTAIAKSAQKAGRTTAPILCKRRGDPIKRFRHRAILVDGKYVELVRHIRKARVWPDGSAYGATSISRSSLEATKHIIFYINVQAYRRRVIRSRSDTLLRALFRSGSKRKSIYIPLDGRPENPRYDFLADVGNWSK